MSSVFLYLAIVAMWGGVLVPMWLRRDHDGMARRSRRTADAGDAALPAFTSTADAADDTAPLAAISLENPPPEEEDHSHRDAPDPRSQMPDTYEGEEPPRDEAEAEEAEAGTRGAEARAPRPARRRARIVALRRRRLLYCVLLLATGVILTTAKVTPWWAPIPFVLLLTGYLAVLRTAVRMDAERRAALAKARALRAQARHERALARKRAEESQRSAEIIALKPKDEPFDQYAEPHRPAVGD
ncbi:hypothetical protein [Bailinhaonella thermotolerans]|uniref:Transmembrane protein n=1 Tax=Bailinhaonella thermotolerans TaxID=1070861 RepID=A0A3A4AZZ9_9ACTN|nr:hypothetical protein [Bailinhaonella thermotolerans]RJL33248.1 hypothetical protein D5H75_10505 [Bailinhaonella thermotolerans]